MDRRRSRREFLKPVKRTPPPQDLDLLRFSRPAMGTEFEILVPVQYRGKLRAVHQALDEIRRLEEIMSYFRESSRVAELNRDAAARPVEVEPELFELLELGLEIHRETAGAFDLAAGALWRCWGFHRKQGRVPAPDEIGRALAEGGSDSVELLEGRCVRFRRPGVEVNLGSIGKGFALDRVVPILQNAGLEQALLHAGHSSFYAIGDSAPDRTGWRLGIRHPLEKGCDFLRLRLKDMGMGTSGTAEQFFEVDGRRYGHILDPRTGMPSGRYYSVTVLAPSAGVADALSTAFFSLELEEIEDYCAGHSGLGAVVVPAETPLKMHGFGCAGELLEE